MFSIFHFWDAWESSFQHALRIRQLRNGGLGLLLPSIQFGPQLSRPLGHFLCQVTRFSGIVLQVVEANGIVFMELDQLPLPSHQAGGRESAPRVGLPVGQVDVQAPALQVERVVPEYAALLDFLAQQQGGNVGSVDGLLLG